MLNTILSRPLRLNTHIIQPHSIQVQPQVVSNTRYSEVSSRSANLARNLKLKLPFTASIGPLITPNFASFQAKFRLQRHLSGPNT
jgi:hypothetical protein